MTKALHKRKHACVRIAGAPSLRDIQTKMSNNLIMKGNEFIKKIKKLAQKKGIEVRVDLKRGKGSHVTLYFGDRLTILRNPKDELKTGTLKAMLKQLGITQDEFNDT